MLDLAAMFVDVQFMHDRNRHSLIAVLELDDRDFLHDRCRWKENTAQGRNNKTPARETITRAEQHAAHVSLPVRMPSGIAIAVSFSSSSNICNINTPAAHAHLPPCVLASMTKTTRRFFGPNCVLIQRGEELIEYIAQCAVSFLPSRILKRKVGACFALLEDRK